MRASKIPRISQICTRDRTIGVRLRLEKPELLLLSGVLSAEECDELISRAEAKLSPSTTIDPETGGLKVFERRTSWGTYFLLEENDLVARIDQRLADLVRWPLNHAEGIQVLKYGVGGEYTPHFDFFPPEEAGSKVHTAKGGQRIATVIMYLNDVPEGGETIFPTISLSIPPRKGDAVYFAYWNSLGDVDRLTLHGGAPVIQGDKWIATKWIRQNCRR